MSTSSARQSPSCPTSATANAFTGALSSAGSAGRLRVLVGESEAFADRLDHLARVRVEVVEDSLHLLLPEPQVLQQVQLTERPDLVELVVVRGVLAEPLQHLCRQRELHRGGQVGQQQID